MKNIPFAERIACTIDEATAAGGFGRTKLYSLIKEGSLATVTVGRRRLVIVRSLIDLLQPAKSQLNAGLAPESSSQSVSPSTADATCPNGRRSDS